MPDAKQEIFAFSRNKAGQFFFDLVMSDKSEKWLARKWRLSIARVRELRELGRRKMLGRR